MQGREEAIRQTLVYALSFLRTQSLNKTAAALVKELEKQPWTAPGTQWRLSGEEASEEAGKCSGAELVSLVRAKLDMVKEREAKKAAPSANGAVPLPHRRSATSARRRLPLNRRLPLPRPTPTPTAARPLLPLRAHRLPARPPLPLLTRTRPRSPQQRSSVSLLPPAPLLPLLPPPPSLLPPPPSLHPPHPPSLLPRPPTLLPPTPPLDLARRS
ncbi:hypothetical protein BJY59DRAFT_370692 [Rhodotorula toruloides]